MLVEVMGDMRRVMDLGRLVLAVALVALVGVAPAEAQERPPGLAPGTGQWVQNFVATPLWSGPGAAASLFGEAERWRFFEVTGPAQDGRLPVRDPRTGGPAWIDRANVDPTDVPLEPTLALPHPTARGALVEQPPRELQYAVPGGEFFGRLVNGQADGLGFSVLDGHGVKMWSAYAAQGGPDVLGRPMSRRFDLDGSVAQGFERGVLRWVAEADSAERLPLTTLPAEALAPEFPPIQAAELVRKPWSGWFWPASDGRGPTLYEPNGPYAKYDRFYQSVTGVNPGVAAWERKEIYFPNLPWAGHCNGYAAAALLEPEPTEPVTANGITFSVADLKGLLSGYHFADAAMWSVGENRTVDPADFHRTLFSWLQAEGLGFVLAFEMGGGEVWNYPVYAFRTEWGPHPTQPDVWEVTTTLWMADAERPADFVGTYPYGGENGKTFTYTLFGDPLDPTGGAWTGASASGRFAQPGKLWYPDARPETRNVGPCLPGTTCLALTNRALEMEMIQAVLAGGFPPEPVAEAEEAS